MPDSGKFKDLYLNSAHTYPCQLSLRERVRVRASPRSGTNDRPHPFPIILGHN